MRRIQRAALSLAAAAWLLTASGVQAQNAEAPPTIDPDAMAALDRMGTYLRSLSPFRIQAVVTTEQVLEDGQKAELTRAVDLLAVKPNRLRVEINSDRSERIFLYDGSSFTLWAPRLKYYATVPAPQSIAQLVTELEDRYDIELPLIDLFRWGTSEAQAAAITAAKNLGPAQIDGVTCQHYAFRQDGLDWQIWIQNGDFPLPRRIVLTTLTEEARPQHTVAYTWHLAPSFNDAAFAFTPSADAKRITLAEVAAFRTAERKERP